MFPTLLDPIRISLTILTLLPYAALLNLIVLFSVTAFSIALTHIGTLSPLLLDSHALFLLFVIDLSLTYLLLFLFPSLCPFPLTLFSAYLLPFPAAPLVAVDLTSDLPSFSQPAALLQLQSSAVVTEQDDFSINTLVVGLLCDPYNI